MTSYDLYGMSSNDLRRCANRLASILSIVWNLHESSYHGGDYYRFGMPGEEEFILQRNYSESDNDWAEPEFKEHETLLYVNYTERSSRIKELIAIGLPGEATLLRHEEL